MAADLKVCVLPTEAEPRASASEVSAACELSPSAAKAASAFGSHTRLSPRALAAGLQYREASRLPGVHTEALLCGALRVVDQERRGTELRVLLQTEQVAVSTREQQVLGAALLGAQDRGIATELGITRQCVCGHLTNVLGKLGVDDRFAALKVFRVLKGIEEGRKGGVWFSEFDYGDSRLLSLKMNLPPQPMIEEQLSAAEAHVAWLVCDGLSNREIADLRGSAERTVANQVAALFHKLGLMRRYDIALLLMGMGSRPRAR